MSTLYRSTFRHNGKKYEKTSKISQSDADYKAKKLKQDLEDGAIGISKKMSVAAWSREWLETYKEPVVCEKGYYQYRHFVEDVILPQIGGLRLIDVTDVHLQKIINARAGNSYSDVKRLRDTIKGIFGKAKETRLLLYNPSEYLKMPITKKGTHRSITDFEREHFLKVAETHHAGLMYKTMLYCGLRPGEAAALSWKDVDFEKHLILVVAAMESGSNRIKAPKTAAGVRSIPIPDAIYYDLLRLRGAPFSPVFTQSTTDARHTESSRKRAWYSFSKAVDDSMGAQWSKCEAKDGKMRDKKVLSVIAPDFVPYCLRHTYCTDLQLKGVSLKMASYLMGHTDISVTANIYTHVTDSALAEAALLIGVTGGVTSA